MRLVGPSTPATRRGLLGRLRGDRVGRSAGQAGTLQVQPVGEVLEPVLGLRDGGRIEGVGLDDVGAGLQVRGVDVADDLGLGQRQDVHVALEVRGPVGETLAPVGRLVESVGLDHGAHGAVEQQDTLGEQPFQHRPGVPPRHLTVASAPRGPEDAAARRGRTPRMWQMAKTRSPRFRV